MNSFTPNDKLKHRRQGIRAKAGVALISLLSLTLALLPCPAQAFSLGLEPVTGPVGSEVKIPAFCQYGEGDYTIYWGEDNQVIARGTVETKGCSPIYFKVPPCPRGKHNVILQVGSKSFSRDFTVTSTIVLGSTKGPVGSQVLITGQGFPRYEGNIRLTYDGKDVATGIEADRTGSWQYTLKIPASGKGTHALSAASAGTTPAEVGNHSFEVTPTLSVSPATGWVGRVVNVDGTGFGAGESSITVLYDDAPVKSGLIADASGNWQASFSIPPSARGTHRVDARGSMTAATEVPEASFTIAPGLRVEQTNNRLGDALHVGDALLASGIGFQADERNISLTFDGMAIMEGITADAQGSWSAQIDLPPAPQGDHPVKASGDATRSDEVSPYTVVITPYLEVNPAGGAVGSSVVLSGTGFSSSQPLEVHYDAQKTGTTSSTDYRGNLNLSFKLPASTAGKHLLTVRDGGGAYVTVPVSIESTPPPIPSTPLAPQDGSVFSLFDRKPIEFTWGAVDDPSGVTYAFEMSKTPAFAGTVLHREGLEKAMLTLKSGEKPSTGKYYWRVRAVDLAGNASDWSKPQSIEFTGISLFWVGIAVGVLVLIGLIIWRIRVVSRKGGWSSGSDSDADS